MFELSSIASSREGRGVSWPTLRAMSWSIVVPASTSALRVFFAIAPFKYVEFEVACPEPATLSGRIATLLTIAI
jgi:hypothetical protein